MKLSHHAEKRMQQRHLPALIVDLLQSYGQVRYQRGATITYFDHKGRLRAERALRQALDRFDKLGNAYLVEASDSGNVITVGYRTERILEK